MYSGRDEEIGGRIPVNKIVRGIKAGTEGVRKKKGLGRYQKGG